MTLVSNDPIWWPTISTSREYSYFSVISFIVVVYDWALTFGQEFELIWRQRWSLTTVLYLSVRYIAIPFTFLVMLSTLPSVSMTDSVSIITYIVTDWINIITNFMLRVVVIICLHAVYQQSRKMLIFLIAIFLLVLIASGGINVIVTRKISGEEYILSGTHLCGYNFADIAFLTLVSWILGIAWEVVVRCFAIRIGIKHFRELPQPTGWAATDCFMILVRSHVFYFASFVIVSFLHLLWFSPKIANSSSAGIQIYYGILQIAQVVQMFVLGPRLILGVRQYHEKLVANSDEGTAMTSMAFQEHINITTGSGV
ncbi:hypothetical protein K503DRAFT_374120 [Rhizopogon vinicolor AM-OR11-026]|uniref:DUF6533 domain-containing protein n=1 Tax=Rhizopogon vinicolor AM-OR11-026 TaxID=1314800 RepID=A0A1B7MRU0_9AGAM|nr:hypothetical protein K503DRAFT_374120 [Rhizopogon vinicolor AM-OR11-026]